MGRPASIDENETFRAIESLLAVGAYPTFARVREALGAKGSPELLQKHLASWYRTYGAQFRKQVVEHRKAMPDTNALEAVATASREAVARVEELHASRQAELDARERQLEVAKQQLEARIQAHQDWIDQMRSDLAAAQERAAAETAERIRLDALLEDLSKRHAATLERDRLQVAELKRLSGLDADLRLAREDVKRLRHLVTEQLEQNKASQLLITSARSERDEAEQRAIELRAELADTRVALSDSMAKAKTAQANVRLQADRLAELAGRMPLLDEVHARLERIEAAVIKRGG